MIAPSDTDLVILLLGTIAAPGIIVLIALLLPERKSYIGPPRIERRRMD